MVDSHTVLPRAPSSTHMDIPEVLASVILAALWAGPIFIPDPIHRMSAALLGYCRATYGWDPSVP